MLIIVTLYAHVLHCRPKYDFSVFQEQSSSINHRPWKQTRMLAGSTATDNSIFPTVSREVNKWMKKKKNVDNWIESEYFFLEGSCNGQGLYVSSKKNVFQNR